MSLKTKTKKPQTASSNQHKKRRGSPLLAALLPILLGLIATVAVLLQLDQNISQTHNNEQIRNLANAYARQVELLLDVTNNNGQALAASPTLANAILNQDEASLSRLEHEWSQLPHTSAVIIMVPEIRHSDHTLSFTELDHLGIAATNQQSVLEYIANDGTHLFYQANPILHPQQPRSIGSLLLVYDASSMLNSLTAPDLPGHWQIRLQQQLPQVPQVVLYQGGPGLLSATPQTFNTAHPYWKLLIGMDTPALADSPRLNWYLLFPLIFLASALASLFLLRHGQRSQQTRNIAILHKAMASSQLQSLADLDDKQLQPLVKPLTSLIQKATATAQQPTRPARPRAQETFTQENSSTKPAFALDEALEIDILDMELDEAAIQEFTAPQTAPPTIDKSIFRAYDIRGIVGQNLHDDTAYWVGRAAGSESMASGETSVVIGRDGRLSSPGLHAALARGLSDAGCSVLDLGMVPTPLVYFGTHQLEATSGVMVTGSHNPPDYNGFKIVIAGETLANERIERLYQRIQEQELAQGSGSIQEVDLVEQYIDYIGNDIIIGNPLKVVVDCGNGVAGVVAPRLLEHLGCLVTPLYCDVDGHFPNHHPDPGKPENLQDLIRKVQEEGADLGLAFDGDGDRLGVVTNKGEIIYSDHLMMLLARDVVSRNPGCDIIFDVKCSRRLASLISRCGGRPVMWKTGHSLMKAKMRETGALLGGEMSGHIFFKERWFGFDDGTYAAARLLEILSMENDTVDRVFARYPLSPATPELTLEVTEDSKFSIIQALLKSADWGDGNITTLDGIRVDYPKGWGLIRASNTTPMLVLRFEGETAEELQNIQNLFRDQLRKVAPDIHWPF